MARTINAAPGIIVFSALPVLNRFLDDLDALSPECARKARIVLDMETAAIAASARAAFPNAFA